MLTAQNILAALPPDIRRLLDWYCELRVQRHAALAVLPDVGAASVRDEVVPADLRRAIECDEACKWLALEMARWPAPATWPSQWWRLCSGEIDQRAVEAAERVREAMRHGGRR